MNNRIYSISRSIRRIRDAELDEMQKLAEGQLNYIHPLKLATQAKQHALGNHNLAVLTRLRELRDMIIASKKQVG